MSESRKWWLAVAVLAAAVGICVAVVRCGGSSRQTADECSTAAAEQSSLQEEELAALAQKMRDMAQRYLQQGDKRKAQRAIGAAQELDRKIQALRGSR